MTGDFGFSGDLSNGGALHDGENAVRPADSSSIGQSHDLGRSAAPARRLIYGDAHLIGRVIDNLIDNALKYSDRGSPITFEYELTNGAVAFHVIDFGSGIPEEDLPYVFHSFYRVDKSRNSGIPGSGLGLSIAKEIADMHGGSLSVRRGGRIADGQGPGCMFTLTLPLVSSEREKHGLKALR